MTYNEKNPLEQKQKNQLKNNQLQATDFGQSNKEFGRIKHFADAEPFL